MLAAARTRLQQALRSELGGAAALLGVILLCGAAEEVFRASSGERSRIAAAAGALAVLSVAAGDVSGMIGLGQRTLEEMDLFAKTLLPTLSAAVAAGGFAVTAGTGQVLTVYFTNTLITLIRHVLQPLVGVYIALSTADAVVQDMIAGLPAQDIKTASSEKYSIDGKKRFGIKRDQPAAQPQKSAAKTETPTRKPTFPAAGVPVSENGRRFVVRPMAEENFHLCASLPEFQTLWLSRLLPEGRRPTASSIQVAESALMASVFLQPEFRVADGSALAIFARRDAFYFAGYKKGEPVLWLRCPTSGGTDAMRAAVKKTLGIDEELVDSVLEESLIDPRPALEPFVRPILAQLELSLAYLASKHSLKFDHALLMGLGAGVSHWSAFAEDLLRLRLVAPDVFEGLAIDKGVDASGGAKYLVALGAAIAGAEVSL
jgi:hypothetical protein